MLLFRRSSLKTCFSPSPSRYHCIGCIGSRSINTRIKNNDVSILRSCVARWETRFDYEEIFLFFTFSRFFLMLCTAWLCRRESVYSRLPTIQIGAQSTPTSTMTTIATTTAFKSTYVCSVALLLCSLLAYTLYENVLTDWRTVLDWLTGNSVRNVRCSDNVSVATLQSVKRDR